MAGSWSTRGSAESFYGADAPSTPDEEPQQAELELAPEPRPDLLATIESEIIPRLMLAHRVEPLAQNVCADTRLPPTEEEIFEFARIAACHDLASALAYVESMSRQGLAIEAVLLDLVAPAARLLGEHWKADLRSFTEVSAGLGTLQQVVHVLGPSFAPVLPHRGLVVLAAAPGEQHTLGLYLVGEFMRRAGWGVQVAPTMSEADLVRVVSTERVEMLGFTVSNTQLLKPLAATIAAVRKNSRDPGLAIMLGGALDLAEFCSKNQVSLFAPDPREAVRWLEDRARTGVIRS
jgi:methanogenic corrinoid protein MtbC1